MRTASKFAATASAAFLCLVLSAVSGCFEPPDINKVGGVKDKSITDLEVLVAVDSDPTMNLQGKHLGDVSQGMDTMSQPCIQFQMTRQGAKILGAVTSANLPDRQTGVRRKLGIILDDHLISAPRIMGTITDRGQITGQFTEDEVRLIVAVLTAGELPFPLQEKPVRVINVQGENATADRP